MTAIRSTIAPLGSMVVPLGDETKRAVTNSVARDASAKRIRTIVQTARTTRDYAAPRWHVIGVGGLCWIRTSDLCDVNAAL